MRLRVTVELLSRSKPVFAHQQAVINTHPVNGDIGIAEACMVLPGS